MVCCAKSMKLRAANNRIWWICLRTSMMISFFQRFTTSFSGVPSTKSRILSPLRSFNLLLETPVQLRDIKEIATRYEIFLFDQFGVIHDGDAPLPGALEVLRYLQAARKTVVIISNTSSREKEATDKLQKLGIPQYLFDGGITTSGESAHNWIICEENAKKCCWFAWENYQSNSFLRDLDVAVTSVDDADFLLFQGTQRIVTGRNDMTAATPISLFETGHIDDSVKKLLSIAASRNLPAVCANIDFTAVTAAGTAYMPGMLMTAYEELGGICFAFGKPDAGHFKNAFEKASVIHRIKLGLSESTKLRAIHIGDSILHDIAGASAARIDSVLLTAHGVHRDELHNDDDLNDKADEKTKFDIENRTNPTNLCQSKSKVPLLIKVCDLCDELGAPRPTFVLERFSK